MHEIKVMVKYKYILDRTEVATRLHNKLCNLVCLGLLQICTNWEKHIHLARLFLASAESWDASKVESNGSLKGLS